MRTRIGRALFEYMHHRKFFALPGLRPILRWKAQPILPGGVVDGIGPGRGTVCCQHNASSALKDVHSTSNISAVSAELNTCGTLW